MVTTAAGKWPAYARLSTVAQAGHLSTAPTPRPGTRPQNLGTVDPSLNEASASSASPAPKNLAWSLTGGLHDGVWCRLVARAWR